MVPLYASLGDAPTIARGVEGASVVVNLVGILAERHPGDFDRIQATGAGLIAQAAARAGVERLVHVSAIGAASSSASHYAASKGRGEEAVREGFPAATILRPSIVFGPEDKFFNRFAGMAKLLPVTPVICGDTRFQPVYVGDVADAVRVAADDSVHTGQTYELGGPQVVSFRDLLRYILAQTRRARPLLEIPLAIAGLQAVVAERLPGKPFTSDQLLLLQSDNIVRPGAIGFAELGLTPTSYEVIAPDYLRRYRAATTPDTPQ